jgi:hypothetical protein
MMKLESLVITGYCLCLVGLTACDGSESVEPRSDAPVEPSGSTSIRREDIRTRADAAFAELAVGRSRFETRIGPQPWPRDLPSNWPKPTGARVVADTTQQAGDRLLLLDVPGTPDEALDSYRKVLRGLGYDVAQPKTRQSTRALHAKRDGDEAVLTFFGRKHATRLEILFIGGAPG